jgi:uncharacterized membrane protein
MNIRFHERRWLRWAAATALFALALVFMLIARGQGAGSAAASEPVPFEQVQGIVRQRCATCHAESPSDPLFSAPPKGIVLETPEQIRARAAQIKQVAVTSKVMPLGNRTAMTDEERALLGVWVDQGARSR